MGDPRRPCLQGAVCPGQDVLVDCFCGRFPSGTLLRISFLDVPGRLAETVIWGHEKIYWDDSCRWTTSTQFILFL